MMDNFPNWLKKKMLRGAKGYNLDAYLMALEGWRRGLTLKWYLNPGNETDLAIIGFNPIGKLFSLEDKKSNTKHYFYRSRGDLVRNDAVIAVEDKFKTKNIFLENNIMTPKGFSFEKDITLDKLVEMIEQEKLKYPLVFKPVLGSLGKGVVTNIYNQQRLSDALKTIKDNTEYQSFIVEEHIEGEEFRLYVVENKVVASTMRIPANIVGNGKDSIEGLIEFKNNERKSNPYLSSKLIKVDNELQDYLDKQNLSLETVPKKDETIYLRGQGNVTKGGDPINVDSEIDAKIKEAAVIACQSVPGLKHAGIDIIVRNGEPYIIEMNATAGISMHMFPSEGRPVNVPEKIMDLYFPNLAEASRKLNKMYFDYRDVSNILRNGYADNILIEDAPKGNLYSKRYIVTGDVQNVGYRQWIRKQAILKGLHGYTRNLKNGNVVVVVASNNKKVLKNFKKICEQGPQKSKVKEVKELKWDKTIQLGFIIKKSE